MRRLSLWQVTVAVDRPKPNGGSLDQPDAHYHVVAASAESAITEVRRQLSVREGDVLYVRLACDPDHLVLSTKLRTNGSRYRPRPGAHREEAH